MRSALTSRWLGTLGVGKALTLHQAGRLSAPQCYRATVQPQDALVQHRAVGALIRPVLPHHASGVKAALRRIACGCWPAARPPEEEWQRTAIPSTRRSQREAACGTGQPVVFGCDEYGDRVSSFECGRPSEPAAATTTARCSSQGVPGFPVTALLVSLPIGARRRGVSSPPFCAPLPGFGGHFRRAMAPRRYARANTLTCPGPPLHSTTFRPWSSTRRGREFVS